MIKDELIKELVNHWYGVSFEDYITRTIGRESFEHFTKTGELKRMNKC